MVHAEMEVVVVVVVVVGGVCVCVSHSVSSSFSFIVYFKHYLQGAIPLTSGGWPPKRPVVRAVNVAAPLTRATEGNGTRHTCVSVPLLLLIPSLVYSTQAVSLPNYCT